MPAESFFSTISPQSLLLALLGGILPALLWLFFWLHEDKRHPEPRGRIAITFILGMVSVLAVIPVEKAIQDFFGSSIVALIILWSLAEEVLKFIAAYIAGLHGRDMDEPIDGVIYLITAALGFAALENTLFLLTPVGEGLALQSLVIGNMRFIGATLLHTLTSGIIGVFIGLSYYQAKRIKKRYLALSLILATGLHAIFNFFIMNDVNGTIFSVFAVVWIAVIALILLIEKVKRVHPASNYTIKL